MHFHRSGTGHGLRAQRAPRDLIYRAELGYMSTRIENFRLHLICERTEIGHAWSGYRGYLPRQMLDLIAPDFLQREVFCCGPTPYMRAVRKLLEEAGYDFAHYHKESFGATPEADIAVAEEHAVEAHEREGAAEDTYCVPFKESGKSTRVAGGVILHAAAASAGLTIPKACGMGICGTCRVKVLEGKTEMAHNGGITDEEIAEGYVLSCCTKVTADVSVDY
ncbi:2Fe-2S iron-sulfur cluster-binding protein [Aromatoleum petrolei]|nr:2Fe-2S iron-sulfur cluster-binding protein [Aromatoleum petrolei]QTQ38573.1 2Fe-2S ferredoxin-like superfamily protein [Aromatoleum petrolei]